MNRFAVQNEVVSDTRTALMWTKNAALAEFPLSWMEALVYVKSLNQSGFSGFYDWRLPNRRELFSLMSHGHINPSLPVPHPFENVFHSYYWTSTTCTRLPNQAWYVHLGGARVFKGMKHQSYMIWPVRSTDGDALPILQTGQSVCYDTQGKPISCRGTGQDGEFQTGIPSPFPRFEEKDDRVLDRATGLTWLKNADICGQPINWESAFAFVKTMNHENRFGHTDWRVPGIRELESLTNMDCHSPALPGDHPFFNIREFYWSATTSSYDTNYAWVQYLKDGPVGVGYKLLPEFYLWPVRGVFSLKF